jgi:hypothetical protein
MTVYRVREQVVLASAGTSLTHCAGAVVAAVSTFRKAVAQLVLTLQHAFAPVSPRSITCVTNGTMDMVHWVVKCHEFCTIDFSLTGCLDCRYILESFCVH